MDISVSRLNGRLASKLPSELPLGLVFVVGEVLRLETNEFVLAEGPHRLSCRPSATTAVAAGDKIRVSGHLMFDPQQLQYYLLARDIDVVEPEPESGGAREVLAQNKELLSALSSVQARAAAAPDAEVDELPVWVQKLAPPEVQANERPEPPGKASRQRGARKRELDTELVALLSAAMDSEEEMELTPELLAPYMPDETSRIENEEPMGYRNEETAEAESLAALSTSYRPANRQDTDWLVILLIISFTILTIAAVVTIVLLIIQ